MPAPAAAPNRNLAKAKKAELIGLLDHLDDCIKGKLPPLITLLSQGTKGETANLIRKEVAAIRSLIKRLSPDVMQWGGTTEKLRYQNLVHGFDAHMRSAELRQQDKERRRFGRLDIDLPVTVSLGGGRQGAQAVNMNMEGIRLRSRQLPRVGDTVQLDIEAGLPLRRVKGKVIWSRDGESGYYEAAVKFLAMEAETKDIIRQFLNEESERRAGCHGGMDEVRRLREQPREPSDGDGEEG